MSGRYTKPCDFTIGDIYTIKFRPDLWLKCQSKEYDINCVAFKVVKSDNGKQPVGVTFNAPRILYKYFRKVTELELLVEETDE